MFILLNKKIGGKLLLLIIIDKLNILKIEH